ncbi:hypothetical protein O181_065356 [Austropuccinia psidii MF-1]|uniref:Uncharacterized protein n=1 Tax=Austropuccinia psidii MF-1 TaxID=1389203 RepID=A0A9Q3I156_9BASI|nr:hypothetical protein [Austropuccinia psidii MF-1]
MNIQEARICKPKPARDKGFTAGESCLTLILINYVEAKVNLDTGAFLTFLVKAYPQFRLPEWKNHLLPLEGFKLSNSSNNMCPLHILNTNIVSPHPEGSVRMKTEILVMENCTSQHIILGDDYLNIYGIGINNHQDIYFKTG